MSATLRLTAGYLIICKLHTFLSSFIFIFIWFLSVGLDTEIGDLVEGSELFTPQVHLDDVVLAEDKKKALLSAVENFDRWQAACVEVGLTDVVSYGHGACLLFHGPSGTGKTMTAHAIANHLGKKILQVAVPTFDIEKSQTILQLIFREAKLSNAIIFFGIFNSHFLIHIFNTHSNYIFFR